MNLNEATERVHALVQPDTELLLEGEAGTGTEALARYIHQASPRREGPFFVVQCAQMAHPSRLEAELSGYIKGSFIGRSVEHRGAFESAAHGVLLLVDAHTLPLEMQAKLLRVLQERAYRPIGDSQPRPLLARLFLSTQQPLVTLVEQQQFRPDLHARLQRHALRIPPLRERADRGALAAQLVAEHGQRELRALFAAEKAPHLTDPAREAITQAPWPGNLAALDECLLGAASLAEPGQPLGPERLHLGRPEQAREALKKGLERALAAQPDEAAQAEAFLDEAHAQLDPRAWRDVIWNAKKPPKPRVCPTLPRPPASIASAVACLLWLDRVAPTPVPPETLHGQHRATVQAIGFSRLASWGLVAALGGIPRWPLLLEQEIGSHFFPLRDLARLFG